MRILLAMSLLAGIIAGSEVNRGRIGPDDTVTISALNVEEISKAWRVGVSGELNLPMVGRVKAAGLTVDQLEAEISSRLKQYVKDPQVTIYVSDFKSHPVTVS